jgi:hypothetical protein
MQTVIKRLKDFKMHPGVPYFKDYAGAYQYIKKKPSSTISVLRKLILDDLFFLLYFVMGAPANDKNGFVVARCKDVQDDVKKFEDGECYNFLDLWARGHFKSTSITMGSTIQFMLKYPNKSTLILSFKKGNAEKFLEEIRDVLEKDVMKDVFPDILYRDPTNQTSGSRVWSVQRGLLLKRESTRKEKNLETAGLHEGMPTGMHYDRIIYDDIETEDMADSVEQLDKAYQKFDMSRNLRMIGENIPTMFRVIGTPYSHLGALVRIRDKTIVNEDNTETLLYNTRIIPVWDENEVPQLVSHDELRELKASDNFNSQQLCDPTPSGSANFTREHLKEVSKEDIPKRLVKFIIVDPAGDNHDKKGDSWSIMCIGVEPHTDDLGASNIYITDLILRPMREAEAPKKIAEMYTRNGVVCAIGIEQINMGYLKMYVRDILRETYGITLSEEDKTLIALRPQRSKGGNKGKRRRIEMALTWPFINGKIHISKSVPSMYREALMREIDTFPRGHDDGLDTLAYHKQMLERTDFEYYIDVEDSKKVVSLLNYKYDPYQAGTWMAN